VFPSACSLLAAAAFPRGPGFYFHVGKLLAVAAVFLGWARLCWWVDRDARALKLPAPTWNLLQMLAGLVGFFAFWSLPFLIGFPALLLLTGGAGAAYIQARNETVEPERRVLTPQHLKTLWHRWISPERPAPAPEEPPKDLPVPIRFIGRGIGERKEDASRARRAAESQGYQIAVGLVRAALEQRATDIHLEPSKDETAVRFRVDGIMHPAPGLDRHTGESIVNIFKVLANLDITERRMPQDGSFSAVVGTETGGSRQVDFRIATAGSVGGEKLVMRILDRARQVTGLEQLGMRGRLLEQVRRIVALPDGMLIVCGPTGAGKSTTLCACITEIDRYQKNIITLENPVEYQIANVTQIEIDVRAGKTFASELRSVLRQDPDIIGVGEIRDQETAEIACQAAQTGHFVYTTLHANDTVTALSRLLDLGVQPFLLASSISAILAQRLVRVLCPECKQGYKPNADLLRKANLPAEKIKHFYRPPEGANDCKNCGGTGYRGRSGIFEVLVMTEKLRGLLREHPDMEAIRQEALRSGLVYLQEDGMRQVIEGQTSIQELLRVCK
jgi:type II secretory ATPase GspE/PulE/Tfp pilus assembly ATPase PilB-like protein